MDVAQDGAGGVRKVQAIVAEEPGQMGTRSKSDGPAPDAEGGGAWGRVKGFFRNLFSR
jgi:hypothetical protein